MMIAKMKVASQSPLEGVVPDEPEVPPSEGASPPEVEAVSSVAHSGGRSAVEHEALDEDAV